jgi:hypothetical protein
MAKATSRWKFTTAGYSDAYGKGRPKDRPQTCYGDSLSPKVTPEKPSLNVKKIAMRQPILFNRLWFLAPALPVGPGFSIHIVSRRSTEADTAPIQHGADTQVCPYPAYQSLC